ncbi:MAG: Hsp20/alpha crystallin family protein [Clostridiales Family XIII bacterium]|jgi:HSP20 family protein|nr:Hsp20/alpha crystallin family protein [Clostridiales Family XIII bacterium]
MTGLIPFNRRNADLARVGAGLGEFYNMLDDFFSDNGLQSRNLLKDTFKIDIEETDSEYRIEAELPGISKDEIDLAAQDDNLSISVNREEETDKNEKNYIHRERRFTSMSRRVRLANANLNAIKAKLEDGILSITIPKEEKAISSRKIAIE